MQDNKENKFLVKKAKEYTISGKERITYQILNNNLPMFKVNKFLEYVGRNSENTGYQYASKLSNFLKFLHYKRKKNYKEATKVDISKFIDSILFNSSDGFLKIDGGRVSYGTINTYLAVIKKFYLYLEDELDEDINIEFKKSKRSAKHTYLYGQIWDIDVKSILDSRIEKMKPETDYIKWYTEEQIEALKDNLNSLRDKAVFELTLEGLRIDEVLSLRVEDIDFDENKVYPYRSKGKETGKTGRVVVIKQSTAKLLNDYMFNERDIALMNKEDTDDEFLYPDEMFINIRGGEFLAKPLKYRNYIEILKKAGNRAGLEYERVRTHSGRSTKTMELLHYQAENTDKLTDEQIRQCMGWRNADSINPYINRMDERLGIKTAEKINQIKTESEGE